jgi:hypothetical protein
VRLLPSRGSATILPADLTLPESGAMPKGFCTFTTADPIIIQFDLSGRMVRGRTGMEALCRPAKAVGKLPLIFRENKKART